MTLEIPTKEPAVNDVWIDRDNGSLCRITKVEADSISIEWASNHDISWFPPGWFKESFWPYDPPQLMEKLRELDDRAYTAEQEVKRLRHELNIPEVNDFVAGVVKEAAHQRERWGVDHDAGKTPGDWFWLVGHLLSKASLLEGGEKRRHRIISGAAALANWFLNELGVDKRMRPGIQGPEPDTKEG